MIVVWCVFRVSPAGRVRDLRNVHATEALAREYIAEHPIPAREGRLEAEGWLVAGSSQRSLLGVLGSLEPLDVDDDAPIIGDFDIHGAADHARMEALWGTEGRAMWRRRLAAGLREMLEEREDAGARVGNDADELRSSGFRAMRESPLRRREPRDPS